MGRPIDWQPLSSDELSALVEKLRNSAGALEELSTMTITEARKRHLLAYAEQGVAEPLASALKLLSPDGLVRVAELVSDLLDAGSEPTVLAQGE